MRRVERPETRFTRACRGQPVDCVPVWLMRQAGRYMPEYQELRKTVDFLTLCRNPEFAARATLDAARILETDAAIIFSDITIPCAAMGQTLTFAPGPKLEPAVSSLDDVHRLRPIDPQRDLGFVLEAVRRTRAELDASVSLIGFVGAPLTLAGYMVEGQPSGNWRLLKRRLFGEPKLMHALVARVADAVAAHAAAQVEAGCDAIQLFDTSAGDLPAAELFAFGFDYARRVIGQLKPLGVPIIYFARNIGAHLEAAAELGADVLALDWTVEVADARRRLGDGIALMGNLDPSVLLTTQEEVDQRVAGILKQAEGLDGFIFNLGHGVLPETPPANARQVVLSVRSHGKRDAVRETT